MSKTLKIISVSVVSSVILLGIVYFGIQQFSRSVFRQRTCEWANIDNIEMHTGIDIPKIINSDCNYDKDQNTKLAWFDMDKDVEMTTYIQRNKFKKLEKSEDFDPAFFLDGENIKTNSISDSEFYYTEGSYETESWECLLDTSSGKLWITLRYRD